MLYISGVCHAFLSVHCCLVVTGGKGLTCWLLFMMFNCDFGHFLMWYRGSGVVPDCIDS